MSTRLNTALDLISRVLRIGAVVTLLPIIFWLVIFAKVDDPNVLFCVGAALACGLLVYHLLTSIRSCEGCGRFLTNLDIGPATSRGKTFTCLHCGQHSVSSEGLVWFREVSG